MKRLIPILATITLVAGGCDTGTEPDDITLEDLPTPPRNTAAVMVTRDLENIGQVAMQAGQLYFFELRTPPPLPRLLYDAFILGAAPVVRLDLESATATGTFTTGQNGVGFLFAAPDGSAFEPQGSCRINVLSALNESGTGRLQGAVDCPVTDGVTTLRVLVKFDHSAG